MTLSKPPDNAAPRRTQFSSCDGCRTSRLACDAVRIGLEPGRPDESGSCSRCIRRGQKCTFEVGFRQVHDLIPRAPESIRYTNKPRCYQWIKNVKRPTTRPRRNSRAVPIIADRSNVSSSSPEDQHTGHTALRTRSEPSIQRPLPYYR